VAAVLQRPRPLRALHRKDRITPRQLPFRRQNEQPRGRTGRERRRGRRRTPMSPRSAGVRPAWTTGLRPRLLLHHREGAGAACFNPATFKGLVFDTLDETTGGAGARPLARDARRRRRPRDEPHGAAGRRRSTRRRARRPSCPRRSQACRAPRNHRRSAALISGTRPALPRGHLRQPASGQDRRCGAWMRKFSGISMSS
jgi:hypothetical protein